MKQYYVSVIMQNPDDRHSWYCTMNYSFSSIEDAKKITERARKNFAILEAWVYVFDKNHMKRPVWHECYKDAFGKVEKVEESL